MSQTNFPGIEVPRTPDQRFSVNVHDFRGDETSEIKVWRYMDVHGALSTILLNELRFTRVSNFRDEWEGRRGQASRAVIDEMNSGIATHSGTSNQPWPHKTFDERYRYNNYVSSWTLLGPNHMTMWLAYTSSDASVAVESTVDLLAKTSTVPLAYADLGMIDYVDPEVWVHNSMDNRELLFIKRPAFAFESEVRFAIEPLTAHADNLNKEEYWSLPLAPGTIHRIVVHPYMDSHTFKILNAIVKNYGLPITIARSNISMKPSC